MGKKITIGIDANSIKSLQGFLQKRYVHELQYKALRLCSVLADKGIEIAKANVGSLDDIGNVGGMILFEKELAPSGDGMKSIIIATDTPIIVEWLTNAGVKSAEVSPLYMAEFGSGFNAVNKSQIPAGLSNVAGQGTFPNQKFAYNLRGWFWRDLEGNTHHSNGITPTRPLYSAINGLAFEVDDAIRKVFV